MSLFKVAGWSVPDVPVQESKKRKRPAPAHDAKQRLSVEVNIEKLVAKMGKIADEVEGVQKKKAKCEMTAQGQKGRDRGSVVKEKGKEQKGPGGGEGARKIASHRAADVASMSGTSSAQDKKSKERKQKKGKRSHDDPEPPSRSSPSKPAKVQNEGRTKDLTALQSGMKSSLDGARFRCASCRL
jgi:ribosomal RNA-processing protein 8